MERQGRVHRLYEDGTVLVLCTGNCALDCEQCAGCQRETEAVIARNPEGARPGELVRIRTRPAGVLLAALMLLILPVASFFAGYWLGAAFCDAGKVTGCIAFTFGIVIGLAYDRRFASKPGSGYTVLKYPQNINKGDNGFD